jgi:hypothetical protein
MKKSQIGAENDQPRLKLNLFRYIMQIIPQDHEKGFVLPLTMLLLLVLSLSVTTILLRSGQQSEQVLTTREDKKVYKLGRI